MTEIGHDVLWNPWHEYIVVSSWLKCMFLTSVWELSSKRWSNHVTIRWCHLSCLSCVKNKRRSVQNSSICGRWVSDRRDDAVIDESVRVKLGFVSFDWNYLNLGSVRNDMILKTKTKMRMTSSRRYLCQKCQWESRNSWRERSRPHHDAHVKCVTGFMFC